MVLKNPPSHFLTHVLSFIIASVHVLSFSQFDMTACAADDHLSIIATAATSDGGVEATMPTDR